MKRSSIRFLAMTLLAVFLAAGAMALQEKASDPEKEEFSANLLLWTGPLAGRTTRVTMTVEHWTTGEEKAALWKALNEGGSDALLKAMREKTAGYIWSTQSLRYPLNIASSFETEKGRVIRLVTERPITFAEQMAGTPRSRDYEFGVIEFTLDEKDKGEGYIIPTAKVSIGEDGKLVVESLGTGPQKLLNLKKNK